jgi:hypothetical protein
VLEEHTADNGAEMLAAMSKWRQYDISNKTSDYTLLKCRRKKSSFSSLQKLHISIQIPLNGKIHNNYRIDYTD